MLTKPTVRSYLVVILLIWFSPGWNPAGATSPVILIAGDSLSAAYGIELSQSWVNLLEQRLAEQGLPHRVANISISGETSRGGLIRLPEALERYRPVLVLLELGGNDGLRGLPTPQLQNNLAGMIELSQQAGARVVLTGMRIPPNYGPRYTRQFMAVFEELAQRYQTALIPFLLEGVAGDPALMQSDGVHPRAEGQRRILDNVWTVLEPLLKRESAATAPVADR